MSASASPGHLHHVMPKYTPEKQLIWLVLPGWNVEFGHEDNQPPYTAFGQKSLQIPSEVSILSPTTRLVHLEI